jgi:hypothetical protein
MYPVQNFRQLFLGDSQPAPATYGCPWTPPPQPGEHTAFEVSYDPNLNCMRDARGNTVCSDGMHYPPGCPHTPPDKYFTPGVTPDHVNAQGMIEGETPQPKNAASSAPAATTSSGTPAPSAPPSPALLVGAGALGVAALATGAYFLFLKK